MIELTPLDQRFLIAIESIAHELKRANDASDAENRRIVSCAEAAEICGVAPQTISVWIRKGIVNKVRQNGRTGIPLDELPYRKTKKKTP